ncbi:phosphoglycerate dehydrogenase [Morganella morganii]|uniref:phosphoglycerate dehydrogenase n=1 Tax=Morganella morganii TaxID=582 RepID=UPI000788A445|nr:phosphoglycerate dehydrogenase [Morganella morganii]EKL3978559.1 phosphoglycerate dehydrogenase [Morganella morganii]EKV4236677.1 phosphoglycerate dehydrogenase [Morganella morganii]ELB1014759.1 phosphoglycerate dehydrogenase [Morganella morganii]ELL8928883.1 phosphoglycerate dehydrogenase [Morganella morganii]ELY4879882.1 phosphoglycerate dehydrogenase [Morganella morganii]
MVKVSLEKDKIKFLLLEGVHQSAVDSLKAAGYSNIEYHKGALSTEELKEAIRDARFIGIRSRTQLTEEIFTCAEKLVAVGCFCIGTNQVDLDAAAKRGIPVFNAPFSNTRSVAEMVLGQLLLLLRRIPEANAKAHRGIWDKQAKGCYEARGKKLGIIGYGHIGTQLGILAESIGMDVYFYDIENKLPLGNATQVRHLSELLNMSDVVSLHVPETESTKNMIGKHEFELMKPGAIFINASRGTVVDIPALSQALASKHLSGAAVDVFPSEPAANNDPADPFISELIGFDNVILTPHIGGSTQEAQENIGFEVGGKLAKYSDNGSTLSAVNFPEVSLPVHGQNANRLLHIHENRPGLLTSINQVFTDRGINIAAQYLRTAGDLGYVVIDIVANNKDEADDVLLQLKALPGTVRARLLF